MGPALASDGLKKHRMTMSGFVVLQPEAATPVGVDRTVREGDVVLTAPVGFAKAGTLHTPIVIRLGGLAFTMPAADLLLQATGTGGALHLLPAGAPILCAPPESNRRKELPVAVKGEKPRFDALTQLCVADSDGDRRMDKAFVAGTKFPEDRAMIDIAPTEFELVENVPIEGSRLQLVYFDGGALWGANFEIHLYLFGRKLDIDGISLGEGRKPPKFGWVFFPKKKLGFPQSIAVGPASFQVVNVDKPAKTAVVRHERDFVTTELRWSLKPQYIYVYVPG